MFGKGICLINSSASGDLRVTQSDLGLLARNQNTCLDPEADSAGAWVSGNLQKWPLLY